MNKFAPLSVIIILSQLIFKCLAIQTFNYDFIATIFNRNERTSCTAIVYSDKLLITSQSCLIENNLTNVQLKVCYYPGQILNKIIPDYCMNVSPKHQKIFEEDVMILETSNNLSLFDESVAANFHQNTNFEEFIGIRGNVIIFSGNISCRNTKINLNNVNNHEKHRFSIKTDDCRSQRQLIPTR